MFKRKLAALDYHIQNKFSIDNEADYRNLIVWIEDQKIRHYKIEDRTALRNIVAGNWEEALHKYLDDLGSPVDKENKAAITDWLLGYAVRLEYGDNVDKYKATSTVLTPGGADEKAKSSNPLEELDFNSPDFKAGVASIAQLLQIPPYKDHLVVLKAISLLVKERFRNKGGKALEAKDEKVSTLPLDQMQLGFETGDYISMEAGKILRLLHIRELRDLQTAINEAIVRVQRMTANPKTDARLGKVGTM